MSYKRFTIEGFRDYRGVQLPDIIEDLKEHRDHLRQAIEVLTYMRIETYRPEDLFDEPKEILSKIDYLISLFMGHQEDFERLVKQLPYGVQEKHIEILNQILKSARFEFETGCRDLPPTIVPALE